ncbi:MAG: CHAD domain-containing protein [Gammaproteobacteria bacterium]|nr:CHAD domain-containing protein [Gammaproteobacteria bacterium]
MPSRKNLLQLPAPRAARMIALSHLDAANAACQRLPDPQDTEALHDFRVALRRLRSGMRAYRPLLADTVSRKSQRRLRRLARSTNEARDVEVRIAWLRSQAPHLPPRQRKGWLWLLDRLETHKDKLYREIHSRVAEDFPPLEQKLRRQLMRYTVVCDLDGRRHDVPFATITGNEAKRHCDELKHHLKRITSPADEALMHQARIQAKRLRYLLEPIQTHLPEGEDIIKQLKNLQDVLGDLHDAHLDAREFATTLETFAAERARHLLDMTLDSEQDPARLRAEQRRNEHQGLMALIRLARSRAETLFAEIEARYLEGGARELIQRIGDSAERLRADYDQ